MGDVEFLCHLEQRGASQDTEDGTGPAPSGPVIAPQGVTLDALEPACRASAAESVSASGPYARLLAVPSTMMEHSSGPMQREFFPDDLDMSRLVLG
jgi:hypothetical protein